MTKALHTHLMILALVFLLRLQSVPSAIAGYRPRVIDKWLHVTQDGYAGVIRYHQRRAGTGVRAIFVHVQEGTNRGSWQHFHVVRASSTVLIGKNGDIWNLVHKNHAPWTNGDVNRPDQVAIALMNRFGWDPNTWSLTIENEGHTGGLPYTDAQFKSNVWQIWQWLQEFPTIEEVHILRHGQVNSVTRAFCPERSPYRFMAQIFAALKGATVPTTPDKPTEIYRPAWPVHSNDGVKWDGAKDLTTTNSEGKKTVWYADKRDSVTVNVDVLLCRQWANTTANLVRTGLTRGETFSVLGWVEGEEVDGERRWWVTPYGTRIWSGGTLETPRKAAPVPERPDDGESNPDYGNERDEIPVVLNGNTYFPLERHGDEPGQTMRFLENGNERLWAATHSGSPVRKTHPKGSTVRVGYWVNGESVTQTIGGKSVSSNKWFVIGTDKNAITKGGRIWSGMVEEV